MRRFHELVAAHADESADVTIATETDRGLFVGALALIVKDGMSRRGRIEPSIGPERAVEDIKSELVAARPTILE